MLFIENNQLKPQSQPAEPRGGDEDIALVGFPMKLYNLFIYDNESNPL